MKYLFLLLSFASAFSMDFSHVVTKQKEKRFKVSQESLFAPSHLGQLEVYRSKKGFEVESESGRQLVKSYNVDKLLRSLPREKIQFFLDNGYIAVNQLDNKEYTLTAKGRINGGGPLAGMVAAWTVRAIMYSAAAATATTATVTSTVTTGPAGTAVTYGALASVAPGYIATTEGAATAAAILGYSLFWLP